MIDWLGLPKRTHTHLYLYTYMHYMYSFTKMNAVPDFLLTQASPLCSRANAPFVQLLYGDRFQRCMQQGNEMSVLYSS